VPLRNYSFTHFNKYVSQAVWQSQAMPLLSPMPSPYFVHTGVMRICSQRSKRDHDNTEVSLLNLGGCFTQAPEMRTSGKVRKLDRRNGSRLTRGFVYRHVLQSQIARWWSNRVLESLVCTLYEPSAYYDIPNRPLDYDLHAALWVGEMHRGQSTCAKTRVNIWHRFPINNVVRGLLCGALFGGST